MRGQCACPGQHLVFAVRGQGLRVHQGNAVLAERACFVKHRHRHLRQGFNRADAAGQHTLLGQRCRGAQQAHLVQWLSKRLGRPLKVPLLTAQGYELVGGRLLPGDTGARAQFMYQNGAGERVTLYLGALAPAAAAKPSRSAGPAGPTTPPTPQPADTAFRFTQEGPVPGFYWMDQGFGYALSGQLSRPALQVLATAVYQQL